MKTKFIPFVCAALLAAAQLPAQNDTWYFGNGGGLQFSGLTTSPASGSVINTSEGCTNIVDALGNVVMYTDGTNIWNGMHVSQTPTAGLLGGNTSSTQTALIVPLPGVNCGKYFIFTTQAVESDYGTTVGPTNTLGSTGLRVSLATVTGVAPSTTVTILPADRNYNLTPGLIVSERLTTVEDGANGCWVIAHGAGTYAGPGPTNPIDTTTEGDFFTVHITPATTTVSSLSVSTTTFTTSTHKSWEHPYPGVNNAYYTQGQLKANKTGTRLAMAMSFLHEVQLYDFNPTLGVISNQVLLNHGNSAFDPVLMDATVYGLEFSPNGNLLYVSTAFGGAQKSVSQFDLTAVNIPASRVFLTTATTNYTFGQMQLGPDGKIYIAKQPNLTTTTLDVINNPNVPGTGCNYASSAVAIGGQSRLGLPTVVLYSPCDKFISTGPEYNGDTGNAMQLIPAGNNVTHVVLTDQPVGGKINVFNSIGQLVVSMRCEDTTTALQTGALPAGVYVVTYENGMTRLSKRLVVSR